jgi:hypothetical protein
MMTLGTNDGAVSVSFIEGITLDGLLGHTGMILDDQTLSLTSKISRIILQLNTTFVRSVSLMILHWSFCIQFQYIPSTCGACSDVAFESESRATYVGSLRVKLMACQFEFDPQ